jgi:GT2 family glycosyltransferase
LTEQKKKPDEHDQEPEQAGQGAQGTEAPVKALAATPEGQLAVKNEIIRQQAKRIAGLQQELDEARRRDQEARQNIRLVEGEKEEIAAVLERMKESVGWKLVMKYRRIKNLLLPPGTTRRRLYDRLLTRPKNSPPASDFQAAALSTIRGSGAALPVSEDDFCGARLVVLSAPSLLEAGKMGAVKVGVTNLSPYKWLATGRESERRSVRLSYHWRDDLGNIVQWEGERTRLPDDLEPQKSANTEMRIFAPFDAGTYTLELTLVQEGVAWFDQKGSAPLRIPMRVEPSAIHLPPLRSCSIVVPVFNRAALTKSCLLGIERSIYADQLQHEVIVVDNGSTDETSRLLRSWAGSRSNARVVPLERNLGFARACNEGARRARGHYLVFLNNDTLPTPGWLERMLRLAEGKPRVGIVGSKLLYPDGRIQHLGIVFGENKNPSHIYRGFSSNIRPAEVSREYQAVTGACLMVRRDLYEMVGGMDERYENSCEDVDLCLKIRELGFGVWVCADSVVYHFESMTEGRLAHDFRNTALLKARWGHKIEFDMDRWHALDHFEKELTCFEPPERYDRGGDRFLGALWKRVYSCDIPEL